MCICVSTVMYAYAYMYSDVFGLEEKALPISNGSEALFLTPVKGRAPCEPGWVDLLPSSPLTPPSLHPLSLCYPRLWPH